jgi:hypothetical protein
VFLSLTCDPYPELEETAGAMRNAIERLHLYNVGVRVLTKSGTRACRDFQPAPDDPRADRPASAANLGSHPDDAFGATLSFLDEAQSRKWEPRAAPPAERMAGLEEAHRRGIPTWINLAPVVDPEQSLEIIRRTHEYVGLYNAGALSEYDSSEAPIDWADFAERAVDLCRQHHVPCYVRLDTQAGSEAPELGVARMVATKLLDSLMCEEMWRGMCLARKPAWGVGAPCGKDALKAALEWSCVRQTGLW